MAISMLKIRRPLGRLIFNMGIAIPGKTVFLIETAPWWHYMATYISVNIGSDNGLIHESVKPLPWTNVDLRSKVFCGIHHRAISREGLTNLFRNMCLVMILLKLLPHLSRPITYHIEAEAKWMPFRRRHFQVHFLEWRCLNYFLNFTELWS